MKIKGKTTEQLIGYYIRLKKRGNKVKAGWIKNRIKKDSGLKNLAIRELKGIEIW